METTESMKSKIVLMIAHIAGMIDFVALPVWVGTLIPYYGLNPQSAGGLVTLFLISVVINNLIFGPKLNKISPRLATPIGYGVATLAFLGLSYVSSYQAMAALHVLAGLGVGCGLTFTHGIIGQSKNPHKLFGIVGLALGIFGLIYFGAVPKLIDQYGAPLFFRIFAVVLFVATIATAIGFPKVTSVKHLTNETKPKKMPKIVWIAIVGMTFMSITHATIFSFVERIGIQNNFGQDKVFAVLMAIGVITIIPSLLAFFLQKKFNIFTVIILGPVIQLIAALLITNTTMFGLYAVSTVAMPFIFLFTHIFFFGLLATLEPTGRANSLTPSMLMIGSAIGPILGGTVAHQLGYNALGTIAVVTSIIAIICFIKIKQQSNEINTVNLKDLA